MMCCCVRKYHETDKAFMCTYCGEIFGQASKLAEHEAHLHGNEDDGDESESDVMVEVRPAREKAEERLQGQNEEAVEAVKTVEGVLILGEVSVAATAEKPPARTCTSVEAKRFRCGDCGRTFTRRNRLKEHIANVHDGVARRLSCPRQNCGRRFNSLWLLKKHVAVVHEGERWHSCPACDRKFGYAHHVRAHVASQHPGWKGKQKKAKNHS